MAETGTQAESSDLAVPEERGSTTIADKVVQRIASIAASEIEAVTGHRSGRTSLVTGLVSRGLPHADATVAGGSARISVDIAALWPTPLSTLSAQVRDHVTTQVTSLTGVDVVAVDVTVADVVHPQTAARSVE